MTAPTVALTGVERRYGARVALRIDRLVFPPGATAVLGPNGAGKSTLLRLIATLALADTGTVTVDGADLAGPSARLAVRRRLGYAGQLDNLPGRMRVGEFCDYVAALKEIGPRRHRRRWTAHVLSAVALDSEARTRISALSGGMRRRLLVAQSLLGDPELLVLDEPLVSLDAEHRSGLVRVISAPDQPRSTIVATHDGDEVAAVCGHVVVVHAGMVAFAGSPQDLAGRADGLVWETRSPVDHRSARATGPGRFRVVGWQPPGATPVEPTVHDGYLAVLTARTFPAP